jgi:cytochrome oxidase Cu insertion factor (SCO1/SenC/PrrC family)
MTRFFCLLATTVMLCNAASAQLPDGTTAPDFTFSDINGNTQNLYTYLNQGKYVAIDISATWCSPCWDYHNTHILDSLYKKHDDPGDKKWKVMFIELDDNTDSADLHGNSTDTKGNWVSGTDYIILDPPAGAAFNLFFNNYSVPYYPTFYLICPDKKVYQQALNSNHQPQLSKWEYIAMNSCGAAGIDNPKDINPVTIFPNPAADHTNIYFRLNSPMVVKLEVTNTFGQQAGIRDFGRLLPGDQSIKYETSALAPGIYFFSVSCEDGRTFRKRIVIQ